MYDRNVRTEVSLKSPILRIVNKKRNLNYRDKLSFAYEVKFHLSNNIIDSPETNYDSHSLIELKHKWIRYCNRENEKNQHPLINLNIVVRDLFIASDSVDLWGSTSPHETLLIKVNKCSIKEQNFTIKKYVCFSFNYYSASSRFLFQLILEL